MSGSFQKKSLRLPLDLLVQLTGMVDGDHIVLDSMKDEDRSWRDPFDPGLRLHLQKTLFPFLQVIGKPGILDNSYLSAMGKEVC